jgi:hypothetical protein
MAALLLGGVRLDPGKAVAQLGERKRRTPGASRGLRPFAADSFHAARASPLKSFHWKDFRALVTQ